MLRGLTPYAGFADRLAVYAGGWLSCRLLFRHYTFASLPCIRQVTIMQAMDSTPMIISNGFPVKPARRDRKNAIPITAVSIIQIA